MIKGTVVGVMKGDARSLDRGPCISTLSLDSDDQ